MKCNIAVVTGDGIGPDIVAEAVKVLKTVGDKFGHRFEYEYALAGGCAIDKFGEALPKETLDDLVEVLFYNEVYRRRLRRRRGKRFYP